MVAEGEGGGGGKDWECGISRCQLLYMGWINNKVLLCSTWNSIQYPVINHNGKEYEKEYIYTHIYIYIKQKKKRMRNLGKGYLFGFYFVVFTLNCFIIISSIL